MHSPSLLTFLAPVYFSVAISELFWRSLIHIVTCPSSAYLARADEIAIQGGMAYRKLRGKVFCV